MAEPLNETSGRYMRYLIVAVTAMVISVSISAIAEPAQDYGVLLSRSDYAYLASQKVLANGPILQNMSPKELSRLHWIINGELSKANPILRADAVRDALVEFEEHRLWEKMHPGHLWGETPGQSIPN
jgi:hypothetical protein